MGTVYVGGEIEIRPAVPAATLAGTRYLAGDWDDDTDSEVIVIVEDGDHSSVVPSAADRETTNPDSILDDVQDLLDLLGAGHTYRGELRIDDPSGEPPTRVRVLADGERRTAVQEEAAFVYPADYTVPPGPAVVFDAEAARAWLGDAPGGVVRAGDYNIDPDGMYRTESPADWLDRMLNDLTGTRPAAPHVWRCAPGVRVEVVETGGTADEAYGGAVLVAEVAGVRLASRWLTAGDLATFDCDGDGEPTVTQIDAAVEALGVAAQTINEMVERHRLVRATEAATRATLCTIPSLTARLSLADVECALRTLADLWCGEDPHDVLSTRQREVADRVAALVDDEQADDGADGADPPGEHPHEHGDYSDVQ